MWGSITKDTRGERVRWVARWRAPDGKQKKKSFDKKLHAVEFLTQARAAMQRGEYVDPHAGKQLVGDYGDAWVKSRVHLTPASLQSVKSLWGSQVKPRWGDKRLNQVRHEDVVTWVSDMREGGLSASRARQSYHMLTSLLSSAVKERKLGRNEALGVQLPRQVKTERRYLTVKELHALASACGDYRVLVLVLGCAGLRWGEAAGLRVADFDPKRSRLNVVRSATSVNGRVEVGDTKTHANRNVPIPKFLTDELKKVVEGRAGSDLLFPAKGGGFLRNQNARRDWWDAAAKKAGLDGLTPHELRHTAASIAISAGADVKQVQLMLGHSSATVTLDRYSHLWDDSLDVLSVRLEKLHAPQMRHKKEVSQTGS